MDKLALHPAIAHLSDAEIETVIEQYTAGEKIAALIGQFKIKCAPNQLWQVLPPQVLEETCRMCGGTMVQEWRSRKFKGAGRIHCSLCSHQECGCSRCVEIRTRQAEEEKARQEAETVQAIIDKRARAPRSVAGVNDIPLSLAVAFLAFSRCSHVDERGLYRPLDDCPARFAPGSDYSVGLLDSLCSAGLISVSEYSNPGTIYYRDAELCYEMESVHWSGNVEENIKLAKQIEECGLTGRWPEHWYGEVRGVWLELALAECREFYDWCLSERDLPLEDEQAITPMLENILRDFSVGHCNRIILRGVEWAERHAKEWGPSPSQAVRSCQLTADKVRAEKYRIEVLKGHEGRTMISFVLFDVILKIGERAFTKPICKWK